jgi:tetratricopeptide (TPR) repeat protein
MTTISTRRLTGFAVLGLLLLAAPARADEVRWRTDYNAARQEAAQTGRLLVIDLGTENCYWCRELDNRTFRDPNVVTLLNQRCVPLKVDANRSQALADALRVQSYPTLVLASPDGKIVGYQEGFIEAGPFREQVNKALALTGAPEWMHRDYQDAVRAHAGGDYARAASLLKNVVEDGKDRPVQDSARKLLADVEARAGERLARGKEMLESGQREEGTKALNEVVKLYSGTAAARDAGVALLAQDNRADGPDQRAKRARDLLSAAKEDYRTQQFLCCLDRCETLAAQFADLPEGAEAAQLVGEIKSNPEWARQACDQMTDRLGILYLAQADNYLKKGQPQQAVFYLEQAVKTFPPSSKYAEAAQARLSQLQGQPGASRTTDYKH